MLSESPEISRSRESCMLGLQRLAPSVAADLRGELLRPWLARGVETRRED